MPNIFPLWLQLEIVLLAVVIAAVLYWLGRFLFSSNRDLSNEDIVAPGFDDFDRHHY